MAMPRWRFRLRTLLILIAAIALLMWAEATRRRWVHDRRMAAMYALDETLLIRQAGELSKQEAWQAERARGASDLVEAASWNERATESRFEAKSLRDQAAIAARKRREYRWPW
jgi:hypothetical protein